MNLWKFLAVSIAKENCQVWMFFCSIPDMLMPKRRYQSHIFCSFFKASVEKAKQDLPLPMDRVISELSPQQRLAVYEHVVEVSKQAT